MEGNNNETELFLIFQAFLSWNICFRGKLVCSLQPFTRKDLLVWLIYGGRRRTFELVFRSFYGHREFCFTVRSTRVL